MENCYMLAYILDNGVGGNYISFQAINQKIIWKVY